MSGLFKRECLDCGTHYECAIGNGRSFVLLHCDTCGSPHGVEHEDIGDAHAAFLKGIALTLRDYGMTGDFYDGEPIDPQTYASTVEDAAPPCHCSGVFKINAEPRCPECRSVNYTDLSAYGHFS